MRTFDRIDLDNLERRELHLSILTAVLVLILAAGVALLMYPLVFVHPDENNKWNLRIAFTGFCVLSLLVAGYLLDRQRTIRRLKQQLIEQFERNLELRHQARVDLLQTIPDLNHFWDSLAMEFRRAASLQQPLSLLVAKPKSSRGSSQTSETTEAWGEAAKAMTSKLRPTDSIYRLSPGVFGILLPETDITNANGISLRLQEALRMVEAKSGLSFEMKVFNFPEHVGSAHELEEIVKSMLPEKQSWLEAPVTD